MLNFDKYDEDGKELIQKFHDRYRYLNSFKKNFLKLNFSFEFQSCSQARSNIRK
jgi:hypothetical protein